MIISETIRSEMVQYRRRLLASYLYECTRHGRRVTIAELAKVHDIDRAQVLSLINGLIAEPQATQHGVVQAAKAGQKTTNGVTSMTYCATLKHATK